ncbi:dicarboxylate transporter/tellurite-resistance protein TehA [Cellulomonas fimi]|uniref:C4-dicarboxylate transporter/malic acid transport protein n=1 Tax=Cellulomonas fimi (strain ATCC 484 / DSM 20113 / JCM 1341 / CCUG 24087 / LMG 16345 / NBRC 15513 / NCIMB 8980 / NCTC 7547 / NRS-133) TaxID=590998 RepID=F4GZ39_CELFA|nr:dicarboxylate transporter/tellurite-resistance protein TehA [Cellulomonas fimi]AEE46029.1 C4-dicarboxylate transporter/malic acid transport protein [Cellulomonas fimi ATCC 484]NNH06881.1 dicarboxylate transporter/tellurite-resistance protein TehA [Cellulomonas fimi]VEH31355.1 Tellurite resistance protein tehA [Cellulomonas fimi]
MRTLHRVPVSFFGIVLGVFGLGSAWRYGAGVGLVPHWVGEVGVLAGCAVWVLLALIYAYRVLDARAAVVAEWRDPATFAFISLVPAGAVLVSVGVHPYVPGVAAVLLWTGVVGQLAFAAVRYAPLWTGTQPIEATTPALYLPTVGANFISAIGLGSAGHAELGHLFLGAGVISWLTLEPPITHRLRTGPETAPPRRGVVGVQLAPAFVACYAYLSVNGGTFDHVALALLGYGVLQLVLMLRLWRWVLAGGFTPGLWAFSFGLAAMCNTGLRLAHARPGTALGVVGVTTVAIGTALLLALVVATLGSLARGRLLPPPAPLLGPNDQAVAVGGPSR